MEALIEIEDAPLSLTEEQQLAADEAVIERGLRTFYEVGQALTDIQERRLYRATHRTFKEYCEDRWGFGYRRAHLLMAGSEVFDNLKGELEDHVLPVYETQVRPLSTLNPEQQREVWQRAVETAPNGKVTGPHVAQVVQQFTSQPTIDRLAPLMSSASHEWYTPQDVIDRVINFFDVIELDPCSNSKTAPNVPAIDYWTIEDDGLAQPWWGRVYMNPPYGDQIGLWVRRLVEFYDAHKVESAIALLPARTDTAWFSHLWRFPLCFVRGRLKFSGSENSATFPSVIAYVGDDIDGFVRCFGDIGSIVRELRP